MVADLGHVTSLTILNHSFSSYYLLFALFRHIPWKSAARYRRNNRLSAFFKRNFLTFMVMTHHFHFSVMHPNARTVKATEYQVKQFLLHVNAYSENHSQPGRATESTWMLSKLANWLLWSRRKTYQLWCFPVTLRVNSWAVSQGSVLPGHHLQFWELEFTCFQNGTSLVRKQWINRHLGNINNQIFMNCYYKELQQEGR